MSANRWFMTRLVVVAALLCMTIVSHPAARPPVRVVRPVSPARSQDLAPDRLLELSRATAAAGTTWLGSWDFEGCSADGWTSVDMTVQLGDFWHVDDFVGMAPNYQGHVGVIDGAKSLWCGARATTAAPLCSYAKLPGYGNRWNQAFCTTACVATGSGAVVSFRADWDSEADYDATTLEVTNCTGGVSDEDWGAIAGGIGVWDGSVDGDSLITVAIPDELHSGGSLKVRIRFHSDFAWSDEDGLVDTDGGIVIDDLALSTLPTETFESESVGATATASGNWGACTPPGYGDFAGLFMGDGILQETSCNLNLTCLWGFFAGSTATYACGGHSGQAAIPFENDRGQYLQNEIWSPWMAIAGSGPLQLAYDIYNDNPLDNLVYPYWAVRSLVGGCPSPWYLGDLYYWPLARQWDRPVESLDYAVEPGATEVQVSLGVIDLCESWCGVYGSGSCHSHAPLYDDVAVYQVTAQGPLISARSADLFQDTFASDGTTTGTARIDVANDINPSFTPDIRPGDSATVQVIEPALGLAIDPHTGFGAAVYAWVSAWGASAGQPGTAYTQDTFRWPVVDSLLYAGHKWHCLRMDTAFADGAARTDVQPDRFCIDLNDNLFVPGDTIFFVFSAQSAAPGSYVTYWSPFTGTTADMAAAMSAPDECTILPADGKILYVDGFDERGAQPFVESAFSWGTAPGDVDRYDIRAPSASLGNRPGARVVDAAQQLVPAYRMVFWNTGNLRTDLIGDGSVPGDKSNDAAMLLAYLDSLSAPGGVYFSGDNIAEEWPSLTGDAVTLRNTYIEHLLINADHTAVGLPVSPLLVGETGGCFYDGFNGPDTLYAYGGCPAMNDFDILAPTGASTLEMSYDGADGAIIGQHTTNPKGASVGVLLSGFSFHTIRDDRPTGWVGDMDRMKHIRRAMMCLGVTPAMVDHVPSVATDHLAQNYPNPFNPTTTIEFTLRERSHVTLRVYNVAGQLIATLVDAVRAPGVMHRVEWDGHNAAGQSVASGVYFYRLQTKGFTKTKKMVLLK